MGKTIFLHLLHWNLKVCSPSFGSLQNRLYGAKHRGGRLRNPGGAQRKLQEELQGDLGGPRETRSVR